VPIGDLIREGKSLEVHCRSCQLAHRLYVETGSLDLPKRLPLQEVANLLVCLGQQGCYAKRVMKHAHGTIHAAALSPPMPCSKRA